MLLMLLLRGGGNRSATEKRQRVNHMVQRQHPLGTYMQTSHVRMRSAQQQLLLLLLLLLLSLQFVERREDRCLADHGECRYLGKGECRMTWMCQKVRRKRWCMDVALRQPRVGSSSILFAVAYRRRHPSLSAATFHSWRSTTTAATPDKIRFTQIQIFCPPCDGSLVHIKNKTAACPQRERESQRKGKDMRQSQWWYCWSFRRGINKEKKTSPRIWWSSSPTAYVHLPLPVSECNHGKTFPAEEEDLLCSFVNKRREKERQTKWYRKTYIPVVIIKAHLINQFCKSFSSLKLFSIKLSSQAFLSSFPKLFAAANLFALAVVNLISCSVPFSYSSMIELVLSTRLNQSLVVLAVKH